MTGRENPSIGSKYRTWEALEAQLKEVMAEEGDTLDDVVQITITEGLISPENRRAAMMVAEKLAFQGYWPEIEIKIDKLMINPCDSRENPPKSYEDFMAQAKKYYKPAAKVGTEVFHKGWRDQKGRIVEPDVHEYLIIEPLETIEWDEWDEGSRAIPYKSPSSLAGGSLVRPYRWVDSLKPGLVKDGEVYFLKNKDIILENPYGGRYENPSDRCETVGRAATQACETGRRAGKAAMAGARGARDSWRRNPYPDASRSGVISYNNAHPNGTPVASGTRGWSAATVRKKADARKMYHASAWVEPGDEGDKSAYKFPHHYADGKNTLSPRGLAAAMGALMGARSERYGGPHFPGVSESAARRGIYKHLAEHYRKDLGKEPPALKGVGGEERIRERKRKRLNPRRSLTLDEIEEIESEVDSEYEKDEPEQKFSFDGEREAFLEELIVASPSEDQVFSVMRLLNEGYSPKDAMKKAKIKAKRLNPIQGRLRPKGKVLSRYTSGGEPPEFVVELTEHSSPHAPFQVSRSYDYGKPKKTLFFDTLHSANAYFKSTLDRAEQNSGIRMRKAKRLNPYYVDGVDITDQIVASLGPGYKKQYKSLLARGFSSDDALAEIQKTRTRRGVIYTEDGEKVRLNPGKYGSLTKSQMKALDAHAGVWAWDDLPAQVQNHILNIRDHETTVMDAERYLSDIYNPHLESGG